MIQNPSICMCIVSQKIFLSEAVMVISKNRAPPHQKFKPPPPPPKKKNSVVEIPLPPNY